MNLQALFVAVFSLMATSVFAQPVETTQPRGMSSGHSQLAAQARSHEQRVGQAVFRAPADIAKKNWRGKYEKEPLGNMTGSDLRNLLNNRYFIYRSNGSRDGDFFVTYFQNDTAFRCYVGRRDMEQVYVNYGQSVMGEGLTLENKPGQAWRTRAIVYDATTGQIRWGVGDRKDFYGWVQNEYPDFASNSCPGLPRAASVNSVQSSTRDFRANAAAARPIRGARTIFQGVTNSPLTAEMYVYLYPYE
ncbi:hypothetical protein JDO7802_03353 [Jannaschia donghaensis]|uniref:Uncharacterized protein n=2 Tax=Jannaschia donghaensis TaxID=420998 RepID=A0A0M6YN52_9RHOB|nr:hypothetical protein JDO7802_03353 [Jannaschia donghaensis]